MYFKFQIVPVVVYTVLSRKFKDFNKETYSLHNAYYVRNSTMIKMSDQAQA